MKVAVVGATGLVGGVMLKVLEEQGLLRATGKTIVVYNARPKMKTRPVIVPVKTPAAGGGKPAAAAPIDDDEDDDWDDKDEE